MSSWWDKYLAPGAGNRLLDARNSALNQSLNASTSISTNTSQQQQEGETRPPANIPVRISATDRVRRQNALFYGGLGFTFLSLFITRRSLQRKHIAAARHALEMEKLPKGGIEGEAASPLNMRGEGSMDGAEALFLATLNVGAFFMAAVGSFMKFADVADVEDMRQFARTNMGWDVYGGNEEADKELEAWVASVMINKDGSLDMSKDKLVSVMKEVAKLEEERAKNGGKLSPEQTKALLENKAVATRIQVESEAT